MKLLQSLPKPNKLNGPLLIRRVEGRSMLPALKPGQVIIAWRWFRTLSPGDIVVVRHAGLEKIKRVQEIKRDKLYIVGDNPEHSTDSRTFGWIDKKQIVGKKMRPWVGRIFASGRFWLFRERRGQLTQWRQ